MPLLVGVIVPGTSTRYLVASTSTTVRTTVLRTRYQVPGTVPGSTGTTTTTLEYYGTWYSFRLLLLATKYYYYY